MNKDFIGPMLNRVKGIILQLTRLQNLSLSFMITNYLQPTDIILSGSSAVIAKWVCHP